MKTIVIFYMRVYLTTLVFIIYPSVDGGGKIRQLYVKK